MQTRSRKVVTVQKANRRKIKKNGRPKRTVKKNRRPKRTAKKMVNYGVSRPKKTGTHRFYTVKRTIYARQLRNIDYTMPKKRGRKPKKEIKTEEECKKFNIGGEEHKFIKRKAEDSNIYAQHAYKKRRLVLPNEIIKPGEDFYKQIVEAIRSRMNEIASLKYPHLKPASIPKYLSDEKKKATGQERRDADKKIKELIANAFKSMVMEDEEERYELNPPNSLPLYINGSQFKDGEEYKVQSTALFNFSKDNILKSNPTASAEFVKETLNNNLKHSGCGCKGGKCNKNCPCFQINGVFKEGTLIDRDYRRHHSCSIHCSCDGKCGSSFLEPPPNGVEAVLHSRTNKGVCLRATQMYGPGETPTDMSGEDVSTSRLRNDDSYAIDVYSGRKEMTEEGRKWFGERYAKIVKNGIKAKHPMFRILKVKGYKTNLKKVQNTAISLDPRNFGNRGRFMSSSCFGTVKVNIVYYGGYNPLNTRVMMTTTMPLFPRMEVSFTYSNAYIWEQLRNCCQCGQLCCVRNIELFPFITDEDIISFFKAVYEPVYADFEKNVIIPSQPPKN